MHDTKNPIPTELLHNWARCIDCDSKSIGLSIHLPTMPMPGVEFVHRLRCRSCDETERTPPVDENGRRSAPGAPPREMMRRWLKCPECGDRNPEWTDWNALDPYAHHWRLACDGCGHEEQVDLGTREIDEMVISEHWIQL